MLAAAQPAAADLTAPFRVVVSSGNGLSGHLRTVEIVGDASGADLSRFSRGPKFSSAAPPEHRALHLIGAQDVARLWKLLDAFRWWALSDSSYRAHTDGNDYTLEVRRGAFQHRYRVYIGCGTGEPVIDGKPGPPKQCPQLDAIRAVEAFADGLAKDPAARVAPPEVVSFHPEKLSPKKQRKIDAVDVFAGPDGTFAYEGRRCFRQDKYLACFHSPFPDFAWGELYKVRAVADAPAESPPAPPPQKHVWSFETADGNRCYGNPLPSNYQRWLCIANLQGAAGNTLTRLTELEGGGLVAHNLETGRWVRVVRIYR